VNAAGAVLDDDQGVEAPQQHGVHVDEIDRKDPAGLRGQELPPGRPRPAGRGIDPGGMPDLPHRGGRDGVAELDELALDPPRRCPQAGLSMAMRMTSLRIAAAVDGRPGRRRFV
jgi:hypothetical protein